MPWSSITPWPRLSKRWIPLSIGKISIPRISVRETNCAIQWIVIYPVDSAIHLLINWRLMVISIKFSLVITKIHLPKMATKINDMNTWIFLIINQRKTAAWLAQLGEQQIVHFAPTVDSSIISSKTYNFTFLDYFTPYQNKLDLVGPVEHNIHICMIQRCYCKHSWLHKHLGTGIHLNLQN